MTASILILDDSLAVRMDLAQAFGEAGFRSIVCSTAAETRNAVANEPVALLVLDVLLPDGNGLELLSEFQARAETAHIPVLMMSTEAEVDDRIAALQRGADDFIGKPYEAHYVVARAQELLGLQPQENQHQGPCILLIDDSLTFRNSLGRTLEEAGYDVLTASSGEDGLLLAGNNRPAAILVDGVLPGINGATVIRRIRLDPALRHTPCLLLTASEQLRAESEALEAGADAFIHKAEDVDCVLARLRAALRRSELPPPHPELASSLAHPRRILAIDDDPAYLDALAAALRGEGFDTVLAHCGEEALLLLSMQPVDCILLDLDMPGLGGERTCAQIKAAPNTREIPLLMLSESEEHETIARTLDAGADDCLRKSSDFEGLRAHVQAQLRRREFEQESRREHQTELERKLESARARAAQELAETRALLVDQLEYKNRELEAFSYSVSHDLRAPLRSIAGFSAALLDDHAHGLDPTGLDYLKRVHAAAQRMGGLIDDLLRLSRVATAEPLRCAVDLSTLAAGILQELARAEPERAVEVVIEPDLWATADPRLARVALDNLLRNAWKFSQGTPQARVEFGAVVRQSDVTYFVRDNGAGFDMSHQSKLFRPFKRLHSEATFPGTGVGLCTVERIVTRHGGRVWAEGRVGHGATFYFTLPAARTTEAR